MGDSADAKLASLTQSQFLKKNLIGVDLVDAARRQLVFLREVDRHPGLYSGPVVKNAIRRYEDLWLPLMANQTTQKDLVPPLDIHWIWHVHMLSPYYYEKDCINIVGKVIDHRLLSENNRQVAMHRARSVWNDMYKDEPFQVSMDSEEDPPSMPADFQSKSSYDLASAVGRQKVFFYQVSLPHYWDGQFLGEAVMRYKKYLYLKQKNIEMFLVPCYDFDLVWHSHQLHPLAYKKDTTAILGRMLNHDDSVTDRAPDAKLARSDQKTRDLWKKTFNDDFMMCGAMYRGDPPFGSLTRITQDQIFGVFSKKAQVTISNIRLENMNPEDQPRFTLKVSLSGRQQSALTLLKLKGPQKAWDNNGKGIIKFVFDTGNHSLLQFDIIDKKGFLCFGTNHSYGIHNYPFTHIVESTPSSGQQMTQTLPLLEGGTGPTNGMSVVFTAIVNPPVKGPCILALQAGPFQSYTMPENIEQLWGPIPLPHLPEGVANTCIVASHRFVLD